LFVFSEIEDDFLLAEMLIELADGVHLVFQEFLFIVIKSDFVELGSI
jgi:hypothetical protein